MANYPAFKRRPFPTFAEFRAGIERAGDRLREMKEWQLAEQDDG